MDFECRAGNFSKINHIRKLMITQQFHLTGSIALLQPSPFSDTLRPQSLHERPTTLSTHTSGQGEQKGYIHPGQLLPKETTLPSSQPREVVTREANSEHHDGLLL